MANLKLGWGGNVNIGKPNAINLVDLASGDDLRNWVYHTVYIGLYNLIRKRSSLHKYDREGNDK